MAFRSVSVQLPAPTAQKSESQSTVTLSVEQADMQAALHIIDSVVTSGGLVRTEPRQPRPELLVLYNTPIGPTNAISCWVYLVTNSLSVDFTQRARFRSSKAVKNMCDSLADKFSIRYGADSVKISR
jgi:hypothetical protein